jgi:hypothetical protein
MLTEVARSEARIVETIVDEVKTRLTFESKSLGSRDMTRRLLQGGLAAGPLFTLVYLFEGATRADYSAWRHPVSSLALGRHGWMQVANFFASGSLLVAFGVGARRADPTSTWPPRLIAAAGAGLIGAGVFACDPIGGYPPGTSARPDRPSPRGLLHQFFSTFVFVGLPALFVLESRRGQPFWGTYSSGTCAAFLGCFAVCSAGFGQAPGFARVGGLFQRLALSSGFLWLTLRAAYLLRDMDVDAH